MKIRVEEISESNQDDYRRFVLGCPNAVVQQTWEWGQVIKGMDQDEPMFFVARDESGQVVGGLPAFLFECDLGSLLISVPQAGGYGGVVVNDGPEKDEITQSLLKAFVERAVEEGCVLATISTPPFSDDMNCYRHALEPDFELENFFQFIDLKADGAFKFSYNKRRSFKIAREAGLSVTFEDNDVRFDQWYAIQQKRMNELGSTPLPRALFEAARRQILSRGLGFFAYVMLRGTVVGGGLYVGLEQVLDSFLTCSDSDYFDKQPNSLLSLETMTEAANRGYRYFNWQSCSSRQSGVYEHKRRWGSKEGLHYYMTKITGDISRLKNTPVEIIKERYRWHYVMPYEQFTSPEVSNV